MTVRVCRGVCACVCVGKLKKSRENTLHVFSGRLTALLPCPAPLSALLPCSHLSPTAWFSLLTPLPTPLLFCLSTLLFYSFPYPIHISSTFFLTFTPSHLSASLLHLLQSPRTYVLSPIVPRRRARLYLFMLMCQVLVVHSTLTHTPPSPILSSAVALALKG